MGSVTPNPTFRDSSGHSLADYPRASVAVDTALLTVAAGDDGQPSRLGVLLVRRPGHSGGSKVGWSLPGTFLHEGETLTTAVQRSLVEKAGVTGRAPRQLHVFDDPARDERGWVLSVAHMDVVPHETLEALRDHGTTKIAPLPTRLRLPYDHSDIIALAVQRLRADYRESPDPWHLLGTSFTIAALKSIHETVIGEDLQKDTFRRRMIDLLDPLPDVSGGHVGRPAQLFARGN